MSARTTAAPATAGCGDLATQLVPDIVERDDGMFQLGLCDDARGPFETRQHTTAVARKERADEWPSPQMRGPTNGQVGRATSQKFNLEHAEYRTADPLDQGGLAGAVVENRRERSEPLRFPRFGANGLYPGRRREPSPIQPDQVLTAMAFLRMFTPTKRAYCSSYTLKHAAENWGGKLGLCSYVSNGALILAALMLGLVVRPYDCWGVNPNAGIGISKRDFRRITGTH
jgi:hypothetical protein